MIRNKNQFLVNSEIYITLTPDNMQTFTNLLRMWLDTRKECTI